MTATWPALDELDTALAAATPGPWVQNSAWPRWVDEAEAVVAEASDPADAAAIVAAVNLAPKLAAAVRALVGMHVPIAGGSCNGFCEECGYTYPCRTVVALTAALGDPQPDTRQCPATRDDGYRCLEHVPHEQHVDSLGRRW